MIQLKVFVDIDIGLCGSRFGCPKIHLTGFDLALGIVMLLRTELFAVT